MGKVRFTTGRRLLIVTTSPPGSSASCEFFVMICAPQVFINHIDLGLISHCCISKSLFPAPWLLWGYWKAEEQGTENRNVSDRNHFRPTVFIPSYRFHGEVEWLLESGLEVGSNCSSGWSGLSKQGHPACPFTSRVLFSPNSMHSPAEKAKINSSNNNSSNCLPVCFSVSTDTQRSWIPTHTKTHKPMVICRPSILHPGREIDKK